MRHQGHEAPPSGEGRLRAFKTDADLFRTPDGEVVLVTEPYRFPVFHHLADLDGAQLPGSVEVWEGPEGDHEGEARAEWDRRREIVLRMRPMSRAEDGEDWGRAVRAMNAYQINAMYAARRITDPIPSFAELDARHRDEMRRRGDAPGEDLPEHRMARGELEAEAAREEADREEREWRRGVLKALRAPRLFLGLQLGRGRRD